MCRGDPGAWVSPQPPQLVQGSNPEPCAQMTFMLPLSCFRLLVGEGGAASSAGNAPGQAPALSRGRRSFVAETKSLSLYKPPIYVVHSLMGVWSLGYRGAVTPVPGPPGVGSWGLLS